MQYVLRDYQKKASDAAVDFFLGEYDYNALLVLPTGCGKSLIISDIANRLNAKVLVFGPSREITIQNYEKMKTYTDDCSMYSASVGVKEIKKVTFATIGSVKNKVEEFEDFDYVIVDEAHCVNGECGMYYDFLKALGRMVLGLTATPFRLYSERYFDVDAKAMRTKDSKLVMLTNDENKFFSKILYKVQIKELLDQGYLSNLTYYDCRPRNWNDRKIFKNSSGSEFSEKSVQWMMEKTNMTSHVINLCLRLLNPKNGKRRNGILVFTQFVDDAMELCSYVPNSAFVTGETTKQNRERLLDEFRNGKIRVLANVGTLTTGLDIPMLDTIILARPTMSLSLYYQCVGRAIRKYEGKDAWIIDTVGNMNRFGKVADLRLEISKATGTEEMFGYAFDYNLHKCVWKQLTGVYLN